VDTKEVLSTSQREKFGNLTNISRFTYNFRGITFCNSAFEIIFTLLENGDRTLKPKDIVLLPSHSVAE
jgi:hypothetical protein